MVVVIGQDMATKSFARTFADIELDDDNECSMPLNFETADVEEERIKISSSAKNECEAKAFLAKKMKHRKI
ncbi:hypothetical protein V6N13_135295 [Hibiscus sabdariffa]